MRPPFVPAQSPAHAASIWHRACAPLAICVRICAPACVHVCLAHQNSPSACLHVCSCRLCPNRSLKAIHASKYWSSPVYTSIHTFACHGRAVMCVAPPHLHLGAPDLNRTGLPRFRPAPLPSCDASTRPRSRPLCVLLAKAGCSHERTRLACLLHARCPPGLPRALRDTMCSLHIACWARPRRQRGGPVHLRARSTPHIQRGTPSLRNAARRSTQPPTPLAFVLHPHAH